MTERIRFVINGKDYVITEQGGKRTISLPGVEYAHRKIGYEDYLDGLARYIDKCKVQEQSILELTEAIVPNHGCRWCYKRSGNRWRPK